MGFFVFTHFLGGDAVIVKAESLPVAEVRLADHMGWQDFASGNHDPDYVELWSLLEGFDRGGVRGDFVPSREDGSFPVSPSDRDLGLDDGLRVRVTRI